MQQRPITLPQQRPRWRRVTELPHLRRQDADAGLGLEPMPQRLHGHPLHLAEGLRHLTFDQALHRALLHHALDRAEHAVDRVRTQRRIRHEIRAPAAQCGRRLRARAIVAAKRHIRQAIPRVHRHRRRGQSAGQELRGREQRPEQLAGQPQRGEAVWGVVMAGLIPT